MPISAGKQLTFNQFLARPYNRAVEGQNSSSETLDATEHKTLKEYK